MSRRPSRNHSPAFKASAALAAIKGEEVPQARQSWPSSSRCTRTRSSYGRINAGRGGGCLR